MKMSLRTTHGMAAVGHGTVTPVRKVHPVCSLSIKSTLIHFFLILLFILFILFLILPLPSLVLLVASFRPPFPLSVESSLCPKPDPIRE